jgi:hypothetical protein
MCRSQVPEILHGNWDTEETPSSDDKHLIPNSPQNFSLPDAASGWSQQTLVEKISGPCVCWPKNWTMTQIAKQEQSFIEREREV